MKQFEFNEITEDLRIYITGNLSAYIQHKGGSCGAYVWHKEIDALIQALQEIKEMKRQATL